MKNILIIVLFANLLFSFDNNLKNMSLLELVHNKYYSYVCEQRWSYINKFNNKREDLLSLVAYACLKKRYLTPALDLAKVLKTTKEGRKNATYIVTLFLMKKLIIQIINDDLQTGNIKLPIIMDNDLGKVFFYIQTGKYKKENGKLIIKEKNSTYKVAVSKNGNVVIDIMVNGILQKRENYW